MDSNGAPDRLAAQISGERWTVELGEHHYDLVPQKLGYLRSRLGTFLSELSNLDTADIGELLSGRSYELLSVFVPDLMPRYEWEGYPTEEALAAEAYDPEYDRSPTAAQITLALEVAMKANRLDMFKALGKLVDPTLLRATVSKMLADSLIANSPSISAEATDGQSTTFSTPAPTPDDPVNAGSPSLASTGS